MELVSCSLCLTRETQELMSVYDWYWFSGGPFTFVKCSRCGLVYLNPRPSADELGELNQSMWERWSISEQTKEYIGSPRTARSTYPEILKELKRQKPQKGDLLEVGSGQGGFLKACQDDGWNTYGVDISEECVAYARNHHGIRNVLAVDLLEADFNEDIFDVVVMNHLIEHLIDPQAYLKEIHRILNPNGILCISTPNIDSLSARLFGRYWQALFVPLHLVLFSPATLSQMLRGTDYSVLKISHFSRTTNTYILLRSMACVVGVALRKLRGSLREKGVESHHPVLAARSEESRARLMFRRLQRAVYFLASPVVFSEGMVRRGSSITIYARPDKS